MKRVVITGLGVVAPNGSNVPAFTQALRQGTSGLQYFQHLKDSMMGCCVAGVPRDYDPASLASYLTPASYRSLRSTTVQFALSAAIEAWTHAGFTIGGKDWLTDAGCVFGNGVCDVGHMRHAIQMFDNKEVQQFGVRHIEQLMTSGSSAYIGGLLGLGNQVTANSSACSTGTEAVVMAYERIHSGSARRMLAGSCEANSPYIWGVFDAMRVLNRNFNHDPEAASRPMDADSAGFVPGCGAGALVLEELESAVSRGAPIIAEVLSGYVNSGGQRGGGSMTAPSGAGVQTCIEASIRQAGIDPGEIDLVCGHLTGTGADRLEVANWAAALQRRGVDFPLINTSKSLTGHCISATGSIECVAALVQMDQQFVQPNRNCPNIHPDITAIIDPDCVVRQPMERTLNTVIKANFGFGDVNSCVIFRKYKS